MDRRNHTQYSHQICEIGPLRNPLSEGPVRQTMADGDPLADLFKAVCSPGGCPDRITSESQWRTFANSLASEGLVVELAEQQQLQKLWDRAVVGAKSFGRRTNPSLSIDDVYRCVDEMYSDDTSTAIDNRISDAYERVKELQTLLEAWEMESFNQTQTRQALQVMSRLEMSHRKSIEHLQEKQERQNGTFITESVLRLMGDPLQSKRDPQGGGWSPHLEGLCNPLVWQASNAGLVDRKVAKERVRSIRYLAVPDASRQHLSRREYSGAQSDPWGVSQGLAGSQAICCRRGFASRPNCGEEIPVTVVAMPKDGLGFRAREKLWRAFLAHRQLALGGCVMHSFGVADRDPEETLFYFENMRARPASLLLTRRRLMEDGPLFRHWARGALVCLAQLSEQSTFSIEKRISTANLMIGEQGRAVRLGGLCWGPEIYGVGQATERELQKRESDLCLGLADILEGLLGLNGPTGERDDDEGRESDDSMVENTGDDGGPRSTASLKLVNILAWLRLPAQSRNGITLKDLLGHQLFAPLPHPSIGIELPAAWKVFVDQRQ